MGGGKPPPSLEEEICSGLYSIGGEGENKKPITHGAGFRPRTGAVAEEGLGDGGTTGERPRVC
jgi:hypothetical protein